MNLAGNSVSALVNQLVASGLMRRDTDQQDRRAAKLFLTAKATARLGQWRDTRAEFVGDALERAGAADRELIEQALAPLGRLLEDLRAKGELR
jgi:DNA-binding MarR family transcriptional regulator